MPTNHVERENVASSRWLVTRLWGKLLSEAPPTAAATLPYQIFNIDKQHPLRLGTSLTSAPPPCRFGLTEFSPQFLNPLYTSPTPRRRHVYYRYAARHEMRLRNAHVSNSNAVEKIKAVEDEMCMLPAYPPRVREARANSVVFQPRPRRTRPPLCKPRFPPPALVC